MQCCKSRVYRNAAQLNLVHRLPLNTTVVVEDLALEETTDREPDFECSVLADLADDIHSECTLNSVAGWDFSELPAERFVA